MSAEWEGDVARGPPCVSVIEGLSRVSSSSRCSRHFLSAADSLATCFRRFLNICTQLFHRKIPFHANSAGFRASTKNPPRYSNSRKAAHRRFRCRVRSGESYVDHACDRALGAPECRQWNEEFGREKNKKIAGGDASGGAVIVKNGRTNAASSITRFPQKGSK